VFLQKREASPAACIVRGRSQQKSFLFLLGEKIGRAQNQKSRENFFAGWRALASGGGAASFVMVRLVKSSDFIQEGQLCREGMGLVGWMVLYILIAISFGRVFVMAWRKEVSFVVALPFVLNLVFNLVFTPLQFGLKNNFLAAVDILLVLGTLVWEMVVIFPRVRWIAYIQIPYLLWVSFATILQLTITYLNR